LNKLFGRKLCISPLPNRLFLRSRGFVAPLSPFPKTNNSATVSVTIKLCTSQKDFKDFVQFPYDLYRHNRYWVPPIKKEELKSLQPETNPAFRHCDACFWLALKEDKVVGRIGAIISKQYNHKTGEQLCRLTRLEFIDEAAVSKALLDKAEQWAKEKGMQGIHGPLGFTNLDHQAILIEGFDHLPSIASEYHLPYYQHHLGAAGYRKEMDWVEFRLKLAQEIPEKALKLTDMIQRRYGLKVVHFETQDQLKTYAHKVFRLLNTAFSDLFSFVPLDEELAEFYTEKYFTILNPKFVKVIEDKDENVIGFIIALPSLSIALQKANGKLFPTGWYHVMQAFKKPQVVDLLLTGIHPDWQAQGVSALLITELQKVMQQYGVAYVETTGMIETNEKAINHWKNYDHIQHKRKRCYRKDFA
jgi:GNAT superfamily N-acetyltransferase